LYQGNMMKTSRILTVLAAVVLATVCAVAQAHGFNLASIASPDVGLGLSMLGAAGMITYKQEGEVLTLTPAAAVAAGIGYLFGSGLFGVALNPVVISTPGEFVTEGVVTIGKTSALAIAVGDRLFWDATNKVVNKTTTAQQCVGIAVEAAANPSSTVTMKLGQYLPVAT
jgi:predicted RecA/RadA family phage recombinase